MRFPSTLAFLAALAGCNTADGPKDELLAAATLGPAGGEIEITAGQYQGLRLTVPVGALVDTVVVQMIKPAPPSPGTYASPAVLGGPGPFVRIEPQTVGFLTPATLRLPYIAQSLVLTGPGNVRAMHLATTGLQYIEAEVVDVSHGRIEVQIGSLGGFQVVPAPQAQSFNDYLPAPGTTVPLEDGYSFAYAQVFGPHLGTRTIYSWSVDTGTAEEAVYFESHQVAGRLATTEDWQEIWDTALDAMLHESNTQTPPAMTTTRVYSPVSAPLPTLVGNVTLLGRFGFEVPLHIGSREFRDVLRVRLLTTWQRPDLGPGSSEQVFWFAPGVGLIQLLHDGVIRVRTDL